MKARALLGCVAIAVAAAPVVWAVAVEPRTVLRSEVTVRIAGLDAAFDGYRILHLSDLESTRPGTRESQVAEIAAAARPDLIVLTGDLVRKRLETGVRWRAIRRMASWLGRLPSRDGVLFVQGHGEHSGSLDEQELARVLEASGVRLLLDEVVTMRRAGAALAVAGVRVHEYGDAGVWALGSDGDARQGPGNRPGWLEADNPGAAGWRDYEMTGRLRFSSEKDWIGVFAHGRLSDGEDRFYMALRRGTLPFLSISAHGTTFSEGVLAWASAMPAGRWTGFRLRVETTGEGVRLRARAWPDGRDEPRAWDIDYTDAGAQRIEAGRPGLYAEGPGVKEFDGVRVVRLGPDGAPQGEVAPLWRKPAGSDLLIRLREQTAPDAPMILLSHTPDIFPDAAELGIPLVLAGHTQGGQIRIPLLGPLATDTRLGRGYASGLFTRGRSALFISRGIGTTRVPLRFLVPPEAAVVTLRGAPS